VMKVVSSNKPLAADLVPRRLKGTLADHDHYGETVTVDEINRDSLTKEYDKTQEMIRHYDDLTMRFGTMTQSGVLIFIGLAFGLLSKDKTMFTYLFPFVILFVSMASVLVHMWFKRHRSISQIKISRILEIEKELGWKQFSMVDQAIKAKRIESAPVRKMLIAYHMGLPITLILAYFIILYCG